MYLDATGSIISVASSRCIICHMRPHNSICDVPAGFSDRSDEGIFQVKVAESAVYSDVSQPGSETEIKMGRQKELAVNKICIFLGCY